MQAIASREPTADDSTTLPPNGLLNGLIDDTGIGMTALFLAAFKASRGLKFTLNETDVKKRFGIGSTAFQAAIRELKASRRYVRKQPRKGRLRQFAVDAFSTDQPGRFGYFIGHSDVFAIFDEAKSASVQSDLVKACAVLIYLRSQARTITVEIRHVRRRFNLSRPTASKWLKFLAERDMIWSVGDDRVCGQFTVLQYTAHSSVAAVSNSPAAVSPLMEHQVAQRQLGNL